MKTDMEGEDNSGKRNNDEGDGPDHQQQDPSEARTNQQAASRPPSTSEDSLKERMERKMAAFKTAGQQQGGGQQLPGAPALSDSLKDRMDRKMAAFNTSEDSSQVGQRDHPPINLEDSPRLSERMRRKIEGMNEDSVVILPDQLEKSRNSSREGQDVRNQNFFSSMGGASNSSELLLDVSGEIAGDVAPLDVNIAGPVVSVARDTYEGEATLDGKRPANSQADLPRRAVSAASAASSTQPLPPTTHFTKTQSLPVGQSPGAFQVEGRAFGARPAWVVRGRRPATGSTISAPPQSSLPPEMRVNSSLPPELRTQSNVPPELRTSAPSDLGGVDASSGRQRTGQDDPENVQDVEIQPVPLDDVTEDKVDKVRWSKRSYLWTVAGIVALIALGAGLGVALSGGGADSAAQAPPGESTTQPPSSSPTRCEIDETMDLFPALVSCFCVGEALYMSQSVSTMYDKLKKDFVINAALTGFDHDKKSCEPNNLALHWLAGDIVDNGSDESTWRNRLLLASLFLTWTDSTPLFWTNKTNWLSSKVVCTWHGVSCDETQTTVVGLSLANNNLMPTAGLPLALFDLTALTNLDVSFNNLAISPIPSEISKLINLEVLNLESNPVDGAIPFQSFPTGLVTLNLGSTALKTSISTTISRLTRLETFDMTNSYVSGSLPSELGRLTTLKNLLLSRRSVSVSSGDGLMSTLPTELGMMTSLERVQMEGHFQLIVSLFSELGLLTNLVEFNVNGADGEGGQIPSEIGLLTSLQQLWMRGPRIPGDISSAVGFGGGIPSQFGLLTSLVTLDFEHNSFSGSIPSEIGKVTSLRNCFLGDNLLTGTIPDTIANLTELRTLSLKGVSGAVRSGISGMLPDGFSNLRNLVCLDLRDSRISGIIPSAICEAGNINDVFLGGSSVTCACCPISTSGGECQGDNS